MQGPDHNGSGPWTGPSLLDEGLKVVEVARERFKAGSGSTARCLGPAADKLLVDPHEATLLQLLQVHTQVAIRHFQSIAQFSKGQRGSGGKYRHDRQPAALVKNRIEFIH